MKFFRHLTLVCLLFSASIQAFSQDIHFSHIHASPTVLNPALNGLFRGDFRLIGNAKGQWNGITNGYKTVAGSFDQKLIRFRNADFIGAGLQVASDRAGDLDFSTTSVAMSFSVLKSLDGTGYNYVSFGIQNAYVSNRVDYSKIHAFDDEPIVTEGSANSIGYLDISAGLAWFYAFDKFNSFYLGGSLFHINRADVSFQKQDDLTDDLQLFRRFVIHGGADIRMGRNSYLKPSFIFMDQGPHREITVGSFWKYKSLKSYRSKSLSSIHFGAWLRWYAEKDMFGTDAVVAAVRFDYNKTYFTFTFDVNISSLTKVSSGRGGPEFSVVHIIESRKIRKPTKVRCPDF